MIDAQSDLNGGTGGTFAAPTGCAFKTGCTDSLATNYDPEAMQDDGGCAYDCVSLLAGLVATQRAGFEGRRQLPS